MDNLNRRVSSDQLLQVLHKLVSKLGAMFFFRVFVIPDDCATTFLHYGSIDVLAVFGHNLVDSLHPLLVQHLEKICPLLLIR